MTVVNSSTNNIKPLIFSAVDWEDTHLIAKVDPIMLFPIEFDKEWLQLEYNPWSLMVFGQDREELWEESQRQLAMLWKYIALEDDETKLSIGAINAKNAILEYFRSV